MTSWERNDVTLRRCCDSDWNLLYESMQDVSGHYYFQTMIEPLYPEEEAESRWSELLSAHEEEGRMDLAICVDDEPVGLVSLCIQDERCGIFTAPVFVLPEEQRNGYARDALELLVEYAFHERRLHKFQAAILADNKASIALHESMGCVLEGRFREQVYHNGIWQDMLWYGLTEREWQARG